MNNGLCECGCGKTTTVGRRFVSGPNGRGRRKTPASIECLCCKNIFEVRPHLKDRVYCSSDCRDNHRRQRLGEAHPLYNRVEIKCEICSKPVLVTPSMLQNRRKCFCSPECAKESHRLAITGRPKNVPRSGKNAARIRDGGKCVICEFNHATAVHHILPRKEGGSNNMENLVTLCPNHHYMAHSGLISAETLQMYAKPFSFPNGNPVLHNTYRGAGPNFRGLLQSQSSEA